MTEQQSRAIELAKTVMDSRNSKKEQLAAFRALRTIMDRDDSIIAILPFSILPILVSYTFCRM